MSEPGLRMDADDLADMATAEEPPRNLPAIRVEPPAPPLPAVVEEVARFDPFAGIACTPVPQAHADILMAPPKDEEIAIRPDGIVYLPWIHISQRFMRSFGPGGWGLRDPRYTKEDEGDGKGIAYCEGSLWVADGKGGARFVSKHVRQCRSSGSRHGLTYADAAEGPYSDCLTRCAKDLGVGWQLFDPNFREAWKAQYTEVWFDPNAWDGRLKRKGATRWRKKAIINPKNPQPAAETLPKVNVPRPTASPVVPSTPPPAPTPKPPPVPMPTDPEALKRWRIPMKGYKDTDMGDLAPTVLQSISKRCRGTKTAQHVAIADTIDRWLAVLYGPEPTTPVQETAPEDDLTPTAGEEGVPTTDADFRP